MPTHEGSHAWHSFSITGFLREFLICRFVPGEVSVWGTVVSFQQGTSLTVLFIFTFRPTGTLGSGQGLVSTEGSITGTGRQYIRTCTRSLNRLGGRPCTGSLNRLGGILLGLISSGWNIITGGLNKAGTGRLKLLVLAPGSKNGFWLVMTSAGFTTGFTRTAKDLDNSIASSLANLSPLSSRIFKYSDEGLLLVLGFFLLDLGEGLGESLLFFFPAGMVSGLTLAFSPSTLPKTLTFEGSTRVGVGKDETVFFVLSISVCGGG